MKYLIAALIVLSASLASASDVWVKWDSQTDADYFRVYVYETSNPGKIIKTITVDGTENEAYLCDSSIVPPTTLYSIVVVAYNEQGESEDSNIAYLYKSAIGLLGAYEVGTLHVVLEDE